MAYYFLFRYNRQLGTAVQSIAPEAMELLEGYDWPGNVRELQNVVREALIVSAGSTIIIHAFLPAELRRERVREPETEIVSRPVPEAKETDLAEFVKKAIGRGETDVYRQALEHFDRLLVSCALEQAHGQQNRAAEILGLSRATLRAKLRNMQMSVEKALTPREPDTQEP